MTVGELRQRMDAGEFQRWKVLEWFDPWGQRRDDWRIALLASQIAAIAGVKKGAGPPVISKDSYRAIDCILEFDTELPDDEEVDPEDAEAQKQQRAAAIETQVLKMFGVGVKQAMTPTKKIIQEHDKEK